MPVPLAIMPPFMAYQSIVMGDAFGRGFQFGKRKVSALSNEEFNKLTISDVYGDVAAEYTRMIPTVEKAMAQSTELQVKIVEEMLRVLPALIKAGGEGFVEDIGILSDKAAHALGTHIGHEVSTSNVVNQQTVTSTNIKLENQLDSAYLRIKIAQEKMQSLAPGGRSRAGVSQTYLDSFRTEINGAQKTIATLQAQYLKITGKYYHSHSQHKH